MQNTQAFIDQVSDRIAALAASSPARDLQRNVRALLGPALQRLELVSREEFDVQRQVLARALERVQALEQRIRELEQKRG